MFQHAANIGSCFADNVIKPWAFAYRLHNGFRACGNIDANSTSLRLEFEVSGRNGSRFYIARRCFHDDR
ncbi:hypothetical protein D3C73_1355190 [compost metagenome]